MALFVQARTASQLVWETGPARTDPRGGNLTQLQGRNGGHLRGHR